MSLKAFLLFSCLHHDLLNRAFSRPEILSQFLLQFVCIYLCNFIKRSHQCRRIPLDMPICWCIRKNIAQIVEVVKLDWIASACSKEIIQKSLAARKLRNPLFQCLLVDPGSRLVDMASPCRASFIVAHRDQPPPGRARLNSAAAFHPYHPSIPSILAHSAAVSLSPGCPLSIALCFCNALPSFSCWVPL